MRNLPQDLAVIIVDHGSTFATANEMLNAMAALFRENSGLRIVEPAHMELAKPTIAQAFARCVAQGATRVVVLPYFLSPGQHSTTDIPRLTAEAATSFPQIPYNVAEPLGIDRRMCEIMLRRVREAFERKEQDDGKQSG